MEDKYADLTKWTPACHKGFKEIPFLQIRQNPNAYYNYNSNHHCSNKDALHSISSLDGTFIGWEVRRTGFVSKDGKKLKDKNINFCLGGKHGGARYWEIQFGSGRKHYKLHHLIRYTYPNLISNGNNIKDYPIVDHFDGNRLNNDIKNIRGANHNINNQNKEKRGQIDYIGVNKINRPRGRNYQVRICVERKSRYKNFFTQKEAAIQYDLWATEAYYIKDGNIPKLNFPENLEQYASEIKNKGQLELAIGI